MNIHNRPELPKEVGIYMVKLVRLMVRESTECPNCGDTVTSLEQDGRCVFGSCGCRLWQGEVPDVWMER